jgi:cobalt-zinc-cadmium efflux system outer membrane protein
MACAVAISPRAARAQIPEHSHTRAYVDPVGGLTIDDLVALARRQSPEAAAARARIAIAKGDLAQADRRPNPSLTFEQREQAGGTDRQTAIGLMWPLDLARRSGRTAVASQSVEAASQAAAERDRELAIDVQTRALRLLAAIHHLEVREDMAATGRAIVELTTARVDAGAAPAVERDQARIEAQMAEVEIRRERVAVEEAAAALRAAVGLEPGAPFALRQTLDEVLRSVESTTGERGLTPEQVQAAVNARPDLRQADAEIGRETARRDLAGREGRTDVALTGGYMRTASMFPQLGLTPSLTPTPIAGTFHMITFGATVVLPWRNANQGAKAAATASIDAAKQEREARRLAAVNEIASLTAREANARAALDLFGAGLRDLAAHNLDVQKESYQLGRATLVDVLAETRRYLDVQMAYADAQLELALARVALKGALGDLR